MNRTRAVKLLGIAALLAIVGCGKGTDREGATGPAGGVPTPSAVKARPKLLFITNTIGDWWNAVEKGMKDGGAHLGCDVSMRRNNGDVQGQVDRLKEALSLPDLDGVAVSVLEADAPGIADAMRDLKRAGKAVITIDSDIAVGRGDLRDGYIGTNNFRAGEVAGKAAALLRPQGGKVLAFVATFQAANARDRRDGFLAGAGKAFTLDRGSAWEDGSDKTKARTNVQSAITKTPDVGLLLGLYSYNAAPIAEELKASPALRKKVTVVTFDLDQAAVGHLVQGNIDASVCQNPYEKGYRGVALLKALVQNDAKAIKEVMPTGRTFDCGVRVVVPKEDSPARALGDEVMTIDEMKAWLESKGLKSS